MKLGTAATKVLIFLFEFEATHARLPSSFETWKGVTVGNRGHVVLAYQKLEKLGYITREGGFFWSKGRMTDSGRERTRLEMLLPHTHDSIQARTGMGVSEIVLEEVRTKYPSTVRDAEGFVLRSGGLNAKLGRKVLKGRWKGMPLFSLTLEERKTCPRSCAMWSNCYGNNMHLAHRHRHGEALQGVLAQNIDALSVKYPQGFVVRLHVLGDFYSPAYVDFWERMIRSYKELNVFGYTARGPTTEIGFGVAYLNYVFKKQFCIRFSGESGAGAASVREHGEPVPAMAFLCPEQTGQALSCGACTACWESRKEVSFIRH